MRELERATRTHSWEFVERARASGLTRKTACALLGVDPRTVATWSGALDRGLEPRGRPPVTGSPVVRAELVELTRLVGPHVSVRTIHQRFAPDVSRRETTALVAHVRAELEEALHVLEWHRAGAVWAVDFKTPPTPVDGVYEAVLVVRDLASGAILLAEPLLHATAANVAACLQALAVEHGPPLVLKADNGSNLICAEAQAPMRAAAVELLRSPPGTPSYNGACEAGIGSLSTRARYEAARHGRPGRWTSDDVEAARRQANELGRHPDLGGRSAAEAWRDRTPVTAAERAAFRGSVARHREVARRHLAEAGADLTAERTQQLVERTAMREALVEQGLLSIRGRSVCLLN